MKTVEITEGALVLRLEAERWLKWDQHAAFTAGVGRLQNTRAVDICASVAGEGAVFIEIKDFRAASIANGPRVTSGELAREVAEKVRDTLAGLVWACGREIAEDFHERLTREFLERPKARVILWLETDRFDIAGVIALQDAIRQALKPHIEARVTVTSTWLEKQTSKPLPWVEARSLPSKRIASGRRRR